MGKRLRDAGDFALMVEHNPNIDEEGLRYLGELVYGGGWGRSLYDGTENPPASDANSAASSPPPRGRRLNNLIPCHLRLPFPTDFASTNPAD